MLSVQGAIDQRRKLSDQLRDQIKAATMFIEDRVVDVKKLEEEISKLETVVPLLGEFKPPLSPEQLRNELQGRVLEA